MRKITFLTVLLSLVGFIGCKETNQEPNDYNAQPQGIVSKEVVYDEPKENPTYHKDKEHKYEYRTGESGDYEYNYDVVGHDLKGNEVSGNISINGKYGNGTITTPEGNKIEIEAEWVDYGKLKATDVDGKEYELEVE